MKYTLSDHFWAIVALPVYFISIIYFVIWFHLSVAWDMGQKHALKLVDNRKT
jgi:hypothetical protein